MEIIHCTAYTPIKQEEIEPQLHDRTILYLCDPEKNQDCKKTFCQRECFATSCEKFAKIDGNNDPIMILV